MGQDRMPGQNLTARKGQAGHNSQNRTGGTRLPRQDYQGMSQDRTARTELPGKGCQDRAASTGLHG
jgi:hypothetical protein